jgi:uncharacterized protein (TIRG00374 family)
MNLKRLILFILGIAIFVYCLLKFDILSSIDQLKNVPLTPLLILIILINFVLLIRAIRWQYLVNNTTEIKISFFESLKVISSSFFISFATPGRLGEISKTVIMKDIDKKKAFSLTLIEYIMDVLSIFTLPIIFSIFYFYQIKYFIITFTIIILIIMGIYLLIKNFDKTIGILIKNREIKESKDIIITNIKNILKQKKVIINCLFLSHLNYFIFYLIAVFTFKITGFNASFLVILAGFSIGHLIGAMSFIPSGLGSRELGATAFFIWQGFSASDVIYSLIIVRIIALVPFFIAFLIYMKFVKERS